jgi:hypothetical protein
VHKDLRLSFDGNRYCVPPRYVGHKLTVKADSSSGDHLRPDTEIVLCALLGARPDLRRRALPEGTLCADGRRATLRRAAAARAVARTGCRAYLRQTRRHRSLLARQVRELFDLIRDYGPEAVANALQKAHAARAFGADYIANILRQQKRGARCNRRS